MFAQFNRAYFHNAWNFSLHVVNCRKFMITILELLPYPLLYIWKPYEIDGFLDAFTSNRWRFVLFVLLVLQVRKIQKVGAWVVVTMVVLWWSIFWVRNQVTSVPLSWYYLLILMYRKGRHFWGWGAEFMLRQNESTIIINIWGGRVVSVWRHFLKRFW